MGPPCVLEFGFGLVWFDSVGLSAQGGPADQKQITKVSQYVTRNRFVWFNSGPYDDIDSFPFLLSRGDAACFLTNLVNGSSVLATVSNVCLQGRFQACPEGSFQAYIKGNFNPRHGWIQGNFRACIQASCQAYSQEWVQYQENGRKVSVDGDVPINSSRQRASIPGMDPSQLPGMTPRQLLGQTPRQLLGKTPSQLLGMPPRQLLGMHPRQLQVCRERKARINGLSSRTRFGCGG